MRAFWAWMVRARISHDYVRKWHQGTPELLSERTILAQFIAICSRKEFCARGQPTSDLNLYLQIRYLPGCLILRLQVLPPSLPFKPPKESAEVR